MRLWHVMRADRIDAALRDGVISPTGYPDLARCETKRLRGKGPITAKRLCRHDHDRTPVTWLCAEPIAVSLFAGECAWLFEVDADAHLWADWARDRGVDEQWIAERPTVWEFSQKAAVRGGEWVTESPIPREQWRSIRDLQLNALIPVSATRTA